METALEQVETALRNDDAVIAPIWLVQTDGRAAEHHGEHLPARQRRCQTDLAMLNELDRINDLRWAVRDGKAVDPTTLATEWRRHSPALESPPIRQRRARPLRRLTNHSSATGC